MFLPHARREPHPPGSRVRPRWPGSAAPVVCVLQLRPQLARGDLFGLFRWPYEGTCGYPTGRVDDCVEGHSTCLAPGCGKGCVAGRYIGLPWALRFAW